MAKFLAIIAPPRQTLSLPAPLTWLVGALGTCQWPGEQMRYTLPSGVKISDEERTQTERHLSQIELAINPNNPDPETCWKARLSVLTKMLLAYSVGSSSDQASEARAEAYLEALNDMPPWAIGEAVKRWHRGNCNNLGFSPNYSFAPPPAHLRAICKRELEEYEALAARLTRLLAAIPISEATGTPERIAKVDLPAQTGTQPAVGDIKPAGTHAMRVLADLEKRRPRNAQLDEEAAHVPV